MRSPLAYGLTFSYRNTNGEYERFKEVVNSDHLLNGIDNEFTVNNDEAYEFA
jgi:hypothetical protein